MTRHGRNSTNSAVYSYHERQKDASASGYGSLKCRLGKDSLKGYDCCSLTLQPCRTPMVSPEGWLFDKEALLKYIIEKKQEYARKMKEYERQKDRDLKDLHELAAAEKQSALEKFERAEKNIVYNKYKKETKSLTDADKAAANSVTPVRGTPPSTTSTPLRESAASSSSSGSGGVSTKGALPSFWIPTLTPQAEQSKVEKPDKTIYCPMSGKTLKFKDMIEVKFTCLDKADEDNDVQKLIAKVERYKCAVTHDVLSNATPVAVLKPTGDVVTVECVEKIIRKDMIHPLTGQTLKEKDIILLQRGGTGYAATNDQLKATHYRPSSLLA